MPMETTNERFDVEFKDMQLYEMKIELMEFLHKMKSNGFPSNQWNSGIFQLTSNRVNIRLMSVSFFKKSLSTIKKAVQHVVPTPCRKLIVHSLHSSSKGKVLGQSNKVRLRLSIKQARWKEKLGQAHSHL